VYYYCRCRSILFFKEGTCRYFYRENRKRQQGTLFVNRDERAAHVFFVPVFSSYNSADQKKIESIDKSIGRQHKLVDSTLKANLANVKDSSFTKAF